jgi:hypothetical protein
MGLWGDKIVRGHLREWAGADAEVLELSWIGADVSGGPSLYGEYEGDVRACAAGLAHGYFTREFCRVVAQGWEGYGVAGDNMMRRILKELGEDADDGEYCAGRGGNESQDGCMGRRSEGGRGDTQSGEAQSKGGAQKRQREIGRVQLGYRSTRAAAPALVLLYPSWTLPISLCRFCAPPLLCASPLCVSPLPPSDLLPMHPSCDSFPPRPAQYSPSSASSPNSLSIRRIILSPATPYPSHP